MALLKRSLGITQASRVDGEDCAFEGRYSMLAPLLIVRQ